MAREAAAIKKFHSEADDSTHEFLSTVINKYHKRLNRNRFLILFKHGGWMSKGRDIFGKPKVLADDLRRLLKKDAILYLNNDYWDIFSPAQKEYVVDQALYMLDVKRDNDGIVKEAADGRPLLGTVPPDIEGFADVIRRHGVIMEDVKRLAKALTETNQLSLSFEDNPREDEKEREPSGDPDSDPDAEYDERRQVTLEQAAAAAKDDPMDGVDPHSVPF